MVIEYAIKKRYVDMLRVIHKKKPSIREITKKNKASYIHNRQVLEKCQERGYIKDIFGVDRGGKRDMAIELTIKGKLALMLFTALEKLHNVNTKPDLLRLVEETVRKFAAMKGRLR